MKSRGLYRRHSTPFKLQLCQDIRNGVIGRRDAQRTYGACFSNFGTGIALIPGQPRTWI